MALYKYAVPDSAIREPVKHDFKLGDRVSIEYSGRAWKGTVMKLPDNRVVAIGSHMLGGELGVQMDDGGAFMSAPASEWVKI